MPWTVCNVFAFPVHSQPVCVQIFLLEFDHVKQQHVTQEEGCNLKCLYQTYNVLFAPYEVFLLDIL